MFRGIVDPVFRWHGVPHIAAFPTIDDEPPQVVPGDQVRVYSAGLAKADVDGEEELPPAVLDPTCWSAEGAVAFEQLLGGIVLD